MPTADGRIKGIAVPKDIFVRVVLTREQAKALGYGLGSRDKTYAHALAEAKAVIRKAYDESMA